MVSPQPFFEERGTPLSVRGRLVTLSRLGHEVDLITYHLGRDLTIPGVSIVRSPRIPFVRHVRVGPSAMKIPLDVLLFWTVLARLRRVRYDLIHTHEEASFFGVVLARVFGVPHLYDMHSSLPEQLSNFRYAAFRPLIRVFEWLEERTIRDSSAVITVCAALAEHVRQIDASVPHVMIENVAAEADPSSAMNADPVDVRPEYGCDGKRLVVYTGTLEAYQGIDLLIASAADVVKRRQDVSFLLVGGQPDLVEHYRNEVDQRGLSLYFHFTGRRALEEMPRLLGSADVLVSPRCHGMNSPLKLYSYLRSGKPIVATDILAHTQVLNSDVALLTKAEPRAFADAIVSVLEDDTLATRLGREARRFFDNRYPQGAVLESTEQVVQMAVAAPRQRRAPAILDQQYADSYDQDRFGTAFGRYLQDREVAQFLSMLDGLSGRTLDLGCGTGKLSIALLQRRRAVISADLSREMLRVLDSKARAAGVRPIRVVCDAHNLPFRDGAFECVVSSRMLMHVADWRRALLEACRVTSRAIVVDFPPRRSLSGLAFVVKRGVRRVTGGGLSPAAIPTTRALQELERHGVSVVTSSREFFLPVALHRRLDRPAVSARIEGVCRRFGLVGLLGAPVTVMAMRQSHDRVPESTA